MSVWLALTPAPRSLEFLLGSHNEAQHNCSFRSMDSYSLPGMSHMAQQPCLGIEYANNLSSIRGTPSRKMYDLAAGDVVVFRGRTWHRGVAQINPRVAISGRFVPADV